MMYLSRLIQTPIENRKDFFLEIIKRHKLSLLDEAQLESFIIMYPEWALDFAYVGDLKKAIVEYKESIAKDVVKDSMEKKNES